MPAWLRLVALIAVAAWGVVGTQPLASRRSITGEPEPGRPTEGRVILDGEPIPPPYEVTVTADDIFINGRPTNPKIEPAIVDLPPISDDVRRRHATMSRAIDSYDAVLAREGFEPAIESLIAELSHAEGVDWVRRTTSNCLNIKFDGRSQPELLILHWVPKVALDPDQIESEKLRQNEETAQSIRTHLAAGGLIILARGLRAWIGPDRSQATFDAITSILETEEDPSVCIERLKREASLDATSAKSIARRLEKSTEREDR